jgi:hypothetical protein
MDANLIAGVELVLEKEAAQRAGSGMLAQAVQHQASRYGLNKRANDNAVVVNKSNASGPPSSNSSKGMEDKNDGYGKKDVMLDDDPAKNSKANETGKPAVAHAGVNVTTEASGMPDLSLPKTAALNFLHGTKPARKSVAGVLRRHLG